MRLLVVVFSFLFGACRHASPPAAPVPVEAAVAPHVPPDVGLVPPDVPRESALARRLSSLADSLINRVATVRELPALRTIARGVMDRSAIVARLRARTAREYPGDELTLEGEALKRLGLIPDTLDYTATMFSLLEEQVAGFYDPDEHTLYIAEWLPEAMQAGTMAHELTHALQDQHFDIGHFTHHVRGRSDAQTAAMAVLEGDATATMLDLSLAPSGRSVADMPDVTRLMEAASGASSDQPRLAAAPRALRESLLFPYVAGFALCVERLRTGGHRSIDDLIRHPPDSTEQVLHTEKLLAREAPVDVPATVPAPLNETYELAWHDVMGEFGLRLVLEEALPSPRAAAGARGWGGDHAMLLAPRGTVHVHDHAVTLDAGALNRSALVWVITMDRGRTRDDAEASELATMLSAALVRRYRSAPTLAVPGTIAARDVGDGRVSFVAWRGRTVLFVDRLAQAHATETVRVVFAR